MQSQSLPDTLPLPAQDIERLGIEIVLCDANGRPRASRCAPLAAYLRMLVTPGERAA